MDFCEAQDAMSNAEAPNAKILIFIGKGFAQKYHYLTKIENAQLLMSESSVLIIINILNLNFNKL